jgi:hypothetical protein
MADFESMWQNEQKDDEEEEKEEATPEYLIRDGISRYMNLCTFLAVVFHEGYGEPMTEIFDAANNDIIIDATGALQFHLDAQTK